MRFDALAGQKHQQIAGALHEANYALANEPRCLPVLLLLDIVRFEIVMQRRGFVVASLPKREQGPKKNKDGEVNAT